MRTERINNNIFIELESTNDFSYFVLMKKVTKIHFCADGFFYDWYTDTFTKNTAESYILYYDEDGNKLSKPIVVNVEWRKVLNV